MIKKRSLLISGHPTSISIEDAFWTEFKLIAGQQKRSISDLASDLDKSRDGNLSSAIRLYVLEHLKKKITE